MVQSCVFVTHAGWPISPYFERPMLLLHSESILTSAVFVVCRSKHRPSRPYFMLLSLLGLLSSSSSPSYGPTASILLVHRHWPA